MNGFRPFYPIEVDANAFAEGVNCVEDIGVSTKGAKA